MVDRFQRAALKTRLGIPLLYGIDAVHGDGNMLGATVFPHNIGLGATRDPELVQRDRRDHRRGDPRQRAAVDVRARASAPPATTAGAAPMRASARTRTSSSSMETAIDGFQGGRGDSTDRDRVLATAKHYAGDGDTKYGTASGDYKIDQGVAITNRSDFWDVALRQYVPAVQEHHVGSVMPSFSSVDWTEDGVGNRDQDARATGS